MNRVITNLTICMLLGGIAGCSSKAGTGAVIGSLGGAAVGGLIGSKSGDAGKGAAIGAGVGALGGAAIGHDQDKKDERKRDEAPAPTQPPVSASVTRSDVIEWSQTNVTDDVIIDRIQRSGSTFSLTEADVKQLREARVSERVITAMKASASADAGSTSTELR